MIYLDSNALMKRTVKEPGSDEVNLLLKKHVHRRFRTYLKALSA